MRKHFTLHLSRELTPIIHKQLVIHVLIFITESTKKASEVESIW